MASARLTKKLKVGLTSLKPKSEPSQTLARPRHAPDAPGALVLPRPPAWHADRFNTL
jgi:hypothetical protein